jgi:hypothetical protein
MPALSDGEALRLQYAEFLLLRALQGGRPKARKTLGEKEQDFLDALRVGLCLALQHACTHACAAWAFARVCMSMNGCNGRVPPQSYYFDEAPTMSNEEFDNLRDELYWAGSKIAILRCHMPCHECCHGKMCLLWCTATFTLCVRPLTWGGWPGDAAPRSRSFWRPRSRTRRASPS